MTTALFDKRLGDVRGKLNAVRTDLASGRLVDAAPLVVEVQALCRDIANVPQSSARPLLNELIALYDEIERLSGAMKAQQDEIKKRLADLAASRKAAKAYAGGKPKR